MTDKQCDRCGEVNPAEIHTCTPKQEEGCAECGKKSSEGWALYCVKCVEPVAIVTSDFDGGNKSIKFLNDFAYTNLMQKTLLYTAPPQREWQAPTNNGRYLTGYTAPQKREWVGLTDEEANELTRGYSDDAITLMYETEAKLKEKNFD